MTQPFTQYLRTLRAAMLGAYEHQQYTFGSLLKKLPIVRDASRVPLVSVVLNIDQAIQGLHFYDLEVEFFSNPRRYENFELALNAVESSTGLLLECSYNTDLFDAQSIRRRLEEFEVFLAGIVADANQPVAQIPVLPQTEHHQLLTEWNPPTKVDPQPTCIHQRFEQWAEQTPNATALVYADEHLTYRELNQQANALAHHLRGLG